MTKITLELVATDDCAASDMLRRLARQMWFGGIVENGKLAPGYGISDLDGSVECKVTHE